MKIQEINLKNQQSFKAKLIVDAPTKMISTDELQLLAKKAESIGTVADEIFIHLHPGYSIPVSGGMTPHKMHGYHLDAFGAVGDFSFRKPNLGIEVVEPEVLKKPSEFISEFLDKVAKVSNPVNRVKLQARLESCKGQLDYFKEMYNREKYIREKQRE